ncbi:MAG: long-chain fatty acid--CoA ligase [Rhodobacteraceae bacterium]|nr:MAG: long-chain fatty acid--CoA ligase [Paracoccaceae bacterium]
MNLAGWLAAAARLRGDAPALMTGARVDADYAAFARRAQGLSAGLARAVGLRPGARLALFLKNRPEYLEAMQAAWWAGAAVVPINAKLHPREAAWIVEHAEACAVVTDDPALAVPCPTLSLADLRRLRETEGAGDPARTPDDALAWLFYTSGTTGRPKGVMLSHLNLAACALCYPLDVDPPTPRDAALYAAPMSHGAGLYSLVHVRAGARHVVPESQGFDPTEILDLAPRLGDVSFFAAPTMVRRLVDAGGDGEGIRTVVYGGGPMYVRDIEDAVARMGPRFVQIYGQGESPMTITALSRALVADRKHPDWRARLASVGVAQSCVDLAIAGPEGGFAEPGEDGEILVRGPQVMRGYWRDEAASAAALTDGWLRTGDVGRLSADGFLTLTDRAKDVVISGGTNIYPREVEEAVLEHPDIHECSVVGRPDPEWGEALVAFVAMRPGRAFDAAALEAHLLARIARFKRPRDWRVVDSLPKNAYGKVLKTDLRARLAKENDP